MSATMHIQDCNMSPETWDAIREIARVLSRDNPNLALDIHSNHIDPYSSQHIQISGFQSAPDPTTDDYVEIDGMKFTRKALAHPMVAQMFKAGLRYSMAQGHYFLPRENLVASSAESVTSDPPYQPVEKPLDGVGLEIRNDLTKVFTASALDVQQLDIVITRRSKDGVLVCNMCIEAIDNGD